MLFDKKCFVNFGVEICSALFDYAEIFNGYLVLVASMEGCNVIMYS